MVNIIKRAVSKVKAQYDAAQAEKKAYEERERKDKQYRETVYNDTKRESYHKAFRKATKHRVIEEAKQDALNYGKESVKKQGRLQNAGKLLNGFAGGSANALNNPLFAPSFGNSFSNLESITMGHGNSQDILGNLEVATGMSQRKSQMPKVQGQGRGGGAIIINVGGGGGVGKRAARVNRRVAVEKDWQDNISDLTGF